MAADQRTALLRAAKLAALVRAAGGTPVRTARFGPGAAALDGDRVWLLLADEPVTSLGAALAWARKFGPPDGSLDLVVEDAEAAPIVARRAALFAVPVTVHLLRPAPRGGSAAPPPRLEPVVAAPPPELDDVPSPEAELYRVAFQEAGLELVVEGGVTTAEWLGLEVGRLVEHPAEEGAEGLRLRVGVGPLDQEAGELVHAHLTDTDALRQAADLVRRHRHGGALPDPLNRLVPERWLRAVVLAEPSLVGAAELRPVAPVPPRRKLRDRGVAPLVGRDLAGHPVVVVCSTGVHLDAVPAAADARLAHSPDADLVIAVPERDVHPATTALAGALRRPARVVGVPDSWRERSSDPSAAAGAAPRPGTASDG